MARTTGRSPADTRRLILDAGARLIARRGTAVSVADIAAAAGVSKGGLLYHFPSKDDLLVDLSADLMARFRADVERAADEEEQGPGRLTRAYIRASFADAKDSESLRDQIALAARLMYESGAEHVAQEDADRWRAALHDDGLDPAITRLIIAAADGSNTAPLWGAVLDDADRAALEADLLALTYDPTSLCGSSSDTPAEKGS
ncbi:TetR/AcrR family transcriptional regulator [Gordonia sp. 'Campus']|uniref:TetR/AcrR family transcriptional regulator n=1 Tax=Gordonia sp. 'Campus' TaxID=2915824 RepID=UPI001EE3E5CC|nr:TetR/AcrR family transcriptional regulator [Gordonia sp. 'Campus']